MILHYCVLSSLKYSIYGVKRLYHPNEECRGLFAVQAGPSQTAKKIEILHLN